MNKKIVKLLVFCCIITILGCNEKKTKKNMQDVNWNKDSLGCLGLRNIDYAVKLLKENKLKGSSKRDFVKVFGKPNLTESDFISESLYYLEGSYCVDGSLDPNSDKCYIIFKFEYNKLLEYYEQCE